MIVGRCEKCNNSLASCYCGSFKTENMIKLLVSIKLCEFRKEAKISQQEVAEFLELNRVSIINMEKGRQGINSENLYKLACLFHKEISDFFPKVKKVICEEVVEEVVVPRQIKKVTRKVYKTIDFEPK